MLVQIILILTNAVLVNVGFLCSFWLRYGYPFPEVNFLSYKNSFLFLLLINISALSVFGVYKSRFKSSWDLFKRVFSGLFLGTLLSVVFIYIFRIKWGAFPTTVFVISFFVNLLLIFKLNYIVLKSCKKIKKKIVAVGEGDIEEVFIKKADVKRIRVDEIKELAKHADVDEIVICEPIQNEKALNLLIYFIQKSKINVVFDPFIYVTLLPEKINGNNTISFLSTFFGRKRDVDEFLMRSLDVIGGLAICAVFLPIIIFTAILIKLTSKGTILYKQQRVGKDGRIFTMYKFRTMINDAEEQLGPVLAAENDLRVTKVGRFLRNTRFDELPQLLNVILGQMSLVGPRPERPHFVKAHKALRELRLAVKPGLTGLAQIRSFYDLSPKHKIKYDYLYIQQRSLLLNLYILVKTIPVVLSGRGQ
jgi:lipopolysaccharide/colanic/teichoic acid biosynthesis glycosyltransferase/type III secretion system FlhB-like substrate exporter